MDHLASKPIHSAPSYARVTNCLFVEPVLFRFCYNLSSYLYNGNSTLRVLLYKCYRLAALARSRPARNCDRIGVRDLPHNLMPVSIRTRKQPGYDCNIVGHSSKPQPRFFTCGISGLADRDADFDLGSLIPSLMRSFSHLSLMMRPPPSR